MPRKTKPRPERSVKAVRGQFQCHCDDHHCSFCGGAGFFEEWISVEELTNELMASLETQIQDIADRRIEREKDRHILGR